MYNHKWFPRLFYKKYDGGKESGVIGYFLIEWKLLFSIGLLRFKKGSRENYHSHAFNALTWWLSGRVTEINYKDIDRDYTPSVYPKKTLREKIHKVFAHQETWAITFRGPWADTWKEIDPDGNEIRLTHGRKIVSKNGYRVDV